MLPKTVSENRPWGRCPIKFKNGLSKLAHVHYMSNEQPQYVKTGADIPLTKKKHPNGMPLTGQWKTPILCHY